MNGSREWTDSEPIELLLEALKARASRMNDRLIVVEGEARGADALARDVARALGVEILPYPAMWQGSDGKRDRGAGHKRNQLMLDENPDIALMLSFKDGFDHELRIGGTEDCVRRAKALGKKVFVVSHA